MAKSDASNKDCLVRLFFGRKRYGASRPGGSRLFSLRNYKLRVDQMEDLQLDADEYVVSMADALAIMHWRTKIDAMDVEFVLGSTPFDHNAVRRPPPLQDIVRLTPGTSTFERATNTAPNFKKRIVSLWLLDFDACGPITMNTAGVNQAIKAFIENEPYCPRPYMKDTYSERLWRIFSQRYLETGRKITAGSPSQSLPRQFIQGVMAKLSPPDQLPPRQATGTVLGMSESSGTRGPIPQQPQQQQQQQLSNRTPSRRGQDGQRGGRGSTVGSSKKGPGNRGQGRGYR
ncbi:hypothetical protein ABOM_003128 [Aspergillus bombycis]|uniref:DUF3669 domain-containing protein n=1 Tax=Aspergillus bombycis TaxID=109264 RepID=A0A1F8ABX4_9EURO|nr:hypothetical protein ABOM_003128 [Aspergillus bombycis]OGM48945.1 hypothetical protein ABOM_003128 [Aspergillus bombycis]